MEDIPLELSRPSVDDDVEVWWTETEQTIYDVLHSIVQPGPPIAPSFAAEQINALHPFNRTDGKGTENIWGFFAELWDAVMDIAKQVPYAHPGHARLAHLVAALKALPGPTWKGALLSENGSAADAGSETNEDQHDGSGREFLWRDLAVWSEELWQPVASGTPLGINLELLLARLEAASVTTDWLWRGLLALRNALEDQNYAPEHFHTPDASDKGPTVVLQSATQWMFLAAGRFYDESLLQNPADPDDSMQHQTRPGRKFSGNAGYSMERWSFWRRCLAEIAEIDHLSEELRAGAKQAEMEMCRIEQAHSALP